MTHQPAPGAAPDAATTVGDIRAELAATARALREAWEQHLATTPAGSSPYTAEAVGILALRTQALAALASLPDPRPGGVITLMSSSDPKADRRIRERISEAIGRDPIYILAGSGDEARRWAAARGIREKDWRLMTRDSARGRSRIRLARVGSWPDRPDLADIEHTLQIIRSVGCVEEVTA